MLLVALLFITFGVLIRNVMIGMGLVVIAGYFISEYTENPNIKIYAFWTSIVIGVPYLLIQSNSKKFRKSE